MPMKIDDQRYRVGFVERVQKFLERVDLAVIVLSGMPPYAIEIVS